MRAVLRSLTRGSGVGPDETEAPGSPVVSSPVAAPTEAAAAAATDDGTGAEEEPHAEEEEDAEEEEGKEIVEVVEDEEPNTKDVEDDDVMARAKAAGVARHPKEAYRNPCSCPDAIFALAWGVCFFVTLVVCFEYGWTEMSEAEYDDDDGDKEAAVGRFAQILISQLFVAFGVAQFAAAITIQIGKYALHTSLIFTEIILILSAAFAAQYAYWYTSLFLLVIAVCVILYHANSLHTIEEASATLEVACKYLSGEATLQGLALSGAFVATVMLFVCSLAVYGLYHYKSSKKSEDRTTLALGMFLLICVFFWTSRVLKYVTIATVAGTMKWWWADETPETLPPVQKPAVVALFRTWMFNLGAIAFGSLLVDIFDVCMALLRRSRKWAEQYPNGLCASCLVACCACTCGFCEDGCDVVNAYAFVFVGIHGYSFLAAGKKVIEVFHKMGRRANETETFCDYVFFWQAVSVGLAACIFGIYMCIHGENRLSRGTRHAEVIAGFVGLFGGTSVASVVFALITGANKTTALLFSDTPRVLAVAHPDEFATLATVWPLGGAALGGPNYNTMGEP